MAKKLSEDIIKIMITLYAQGLSSEQIGQKFGSKAQTVTKYLRAAGIEIRGPKKKLTEDDKKEICKLYQEGLSCPKIAEQYDLSDAMVLKILKKNKIDRRSAEECHRKYPIYEDFFDIIDTEEKVYFLGFLYADGCNHKNANYISLGLKQTDRDILVQLASLIYKEEPESHVKIQDRTHENKGITTYFTINSKHICEQLEKLGCPQAKTFILDYPDWMPDHLHKHFIRGYFDGDGGFYLNYIKTHSSTMKITSTLSFVTKIASIFNTELDMNMCIYSNKNSEVFDVCTSGDRQLQKIFDWLYKDASIYLKRKFDKYQELVTKIAETDRLIKAGTQGYNKRYLNK